MTRDPARTRCHEAGHAVIGVRLGAHLAAIVTSPSPGHDPGCLFLWGRPAFVAPPVAGELQERLHSRVCTLLAGELAATRWAGTPLPEGCRDDHGEAREWIAGLCSDGTREPAPEEVDRYFDATVDEVSRLLDDPLVWSDVDALVTELEARPNLLGDDLSRFFEDRGITMPRARLPESLATDRKG